MTTARGEQTFIETKHERIRRQIDLKKMQNILLIWLDTNINNNDEDCRNTVTQMRRVVSNIHTFTDPDECVQFIKNIDDNKACMIISEALGRHIVPCVHNMSQVDSIFIFCGNKKRHEQWVKQWTKIKGLFTEIKPVCDALKQASLQCERNLVSISFVPSSDGSATNKNLDRLDPMFMYSQILKEILLTIKFESRHFQEFIDYCYDVYDDNEHELDKIKKLERNYRNETPIWWYTYECFLYPMLNRALRTTDVDIIIRMGFFIGDLHRHIEELHKQQFSDHRNGQTFTVYRGQGLSKADFEQMIEAKDGLISFNNFLSTSKDHDVSFAFAESNASDPDLVGILFVITIDPAESTTPFASINGVSYFDDKEDEVLFSMHTVFRITDIKSMGENNRLYEVNLTLMDEDDKELSILTKRIREETFPDAEGWFRLGLVLRHMGQFGKSEKVYQAMLNQPTNESEKGNIYGQLGLAKQDQDKYEEALTLYEKAIDIHKTLPSNYFYLAASYNNIGNMYFKMGGYSKALSYYEKAIEIDQQSLTSNHPDLASSYNNIGNVYSDMGEYAKALSYYKKALEIQLQSLPFNHPSLAISYNNIGSVHEDIGKYSKARSFYERAVTIAQKSLPSDHPDLKNWRSNLDTIKKKF